jgi:hypothetical protein
VQHPVPDALEARGGKGLEHPRNPTGRPAALALSGRTCPVASTRGRPHGQPELELTSLPAMSIN